jgi:hypothetical protein
MTTTTKNTRKTDAETILDIAQLLQELGQVARDNRGMEAREQLIAIASRMRRSK